MSVRTLSLSERRILKVIQAQYGTQNVPANVTFSAEGEALLSIIDSDGFIVMLANLTNLANWLDDGSIKDETELSTKWLTI